MPGSASQEGFGREPAIVVSSTVPSRSQIQRGEQRLALRLAGRRPLTGDPGKLVVGPPPQHDLRKRRLPQLLRQEGRCETAFMRHLGIALRQKRAEAKE